MVELLKAHGLHLIEAEKFMMSPVGFPAEQTVEKWMKTAGLSFLLLNQLVAARRSPYF
jgi:hypothetical protein